MKKMKLSEWIHLQMRLSKSPKWQVVLSADGKSFYVGAYLPETQENNASDYTPLSKLYSTLEYLGISTIISKK